MAFADTSKRSVLAGEFPQKITIGAGVTVYPGDLLGYSAAEWKLADGNTGPVYAKAIAGEAGAAGDVITAYRYALIEGFTGGTPGAKLWLSDTGGDYSDSTGTNGQTVGEMATDTAGWVDLRYALVPLVNAEIAAGAVIAGSKMAVNARKRFISSPSFDISGIGAATWDTIIFRPSVACTLLAAKIVYDVETSGVCAAGSVALGSTAGGAQLVAATALVNNTAVGGTTALVLASAVLAAATGVFLRVTGVGACLGVIHVDLEFTVND